MIHSSNRMTQQLVTYGLAQAIHEEARNKAAYPQPRTKKSWRCKVEQHSHCTVLACGCACHEDEAV